MERLSQKEMRNYKANMSSIIVVCFGKSTTFSAYVSWSDSISGGRRLFSEHSGSLQVVMGRNWGKQEEHAASLKAIAGVVVIEVTLCTSERETGNQNAYTDLFKQFCHHNPKCREFTWSIIVTWSIAFRAAFLRGYWAYWWLAHQIKVPLYKISVPSVKDFHLESNNKSRLLISFLYFISYIIFLQSLVFLPHHS